jgi:hypothetical protein
MIRSLIALSALAFVGAACSTSHKTEEAAVAPETKAVAQQNEVSYVADVKFAKGSAVLDDTAKAELDRVIAGAAAAGKIDEIKVLSWADAEYPADVQKALPKAQRDLASRRNRAMNDYIKAKTSGVDIDTYNMAERPNSLEKLFNTSDARIKQSLERAGMPDTATARVSANSSKSTVMLIMDR